MKILLIQETDWLKRGPHQQHQLADRLSLRGYEIRVIDYELTWRTQDKREIFSSRHVFDHVSKVEERADVTVVRPGMIKLPVLEYLSLFINHQKEIERQINEFLPDVILGFGILNSYLAADAAHKHNIPFVYYWIDVLHRLIPVKFLQPLGKTVEKKALKQSKRVVVINEKLGDYVESLGVRKGMLNILPAGIDIEKYNLSINNLIIRQQYKIDVRDKVLFFMGWLYKFAGLKEVAMQILRESDTRLKLLITGEGDSYRDLADICVSHGLQDRIILTGKRPYQEIPGLIAASDICLLPSYPWEPIMQDIVPIKLYEYMAMGKPVISTRLPGVVREFGEDNGIVYVDRPEDTVKKAMELFSDGYRELGAKARKFAENNSWEKITDQFESILLEVVKNGKDNRVY